MFKGTRVTLRTVLASLAEGATTTGLLADFPTRSEQDVRAAIVFTATSAQEDLPLPELPMKRWRLNSTRTSPSGWWSNSPRLVKTSIVSGLSA